ncbi:Regulatory protein AfsR [Mycobacteroides abscessus subsp. bolletii]|nr:Regulatory protein AfsR [Mycobacteroides abscessus subsp. bolletii]SKU60073.1 Regulatory protein AfsR [Mycobacteroides abscessus subsp. bolletii]SLF01044.1 Regulatory protein AfsR [Mycobacteroides abscessus subsp. bolletii]
MGQKRDSPKKQGSTAKDGASSSSTRQQRCCRPKLSERTIKYLCLVSGNLCAYSGCRSRLGDLPADDELPVIFGEMAHIIGWSESSPRGDSTISEFQRAHPTNIICLCERHHKMVDSLPQKYPPDRLRAMKRKHEAKFTRTVSASHAIPRLKEHFVGRSSDFVPACNIFENESVTAPMVGITGPPGIGKTQFACRLGREIEQYFPAGHIYVRANRSRRESAEPLLAEVYRAIEGSYPPAEWDTYQLQAEIRTELTERPILLIIDDVETEAEIESIIEIDGFFGLIYTSTSKLTKLRAYGVHQVDLRTLDPEPASQLVRAFCGIERVSDADAHGLANACGNHPYVIGIVATRLATHPNLSVERVTQQLQDPDRSAWVLRLGERSASVVLEPSIRTLSPDHLRVMEILTCLPNEDIPAFVITRVLSNSSGHLELAQLEECETVLEDLVEANLLDQPYEGTYRLHNIIYRYCRTEATLHRNIDINSVMATCTLTLAALTRIYAESIGYLDSDKKELAPQSTESLTAFDRIHTTILAVIIQTEALGLHREVLILTSQVLPMFHHRGYWREFTSINEIAGRSATKLGDTEWEAAATLNTGVSIARKGNSAEADQLFRTSQRLAVEAKNSELIVASVYSRGVLLLNNDRVVEAIRTLKLSARISRHIRDDAVLCASLRTLAAAFHRQGEWPKAELYIGNARRIALRSGNLRQLSELDCEFVRNAREAGRLDEALTLCEQVLTTAQEVGDRATEADISVEIGLIKQDQGELATWLEPLTFALDVYRKSDDSRNELRTLRILAAGHYSSGNHRKAREYLKAAEEIAKFHGNHAELALSLSTHATLLAEAGKMDESETMFADALAMGDNVSKLVLAQIRYSQSMMLIRAGRIKEAASVLRTVLSSIHKTRKFNLISKARLALGGALRDAGLWDQAAAEFLSVSSQTGATNDRTTISALISLGSLYSIRGLTSNAHETLDIALNKAISMGYEVLEMRCLAAIGNSFLRENETDNAASYLKQAKKLAAKYRDAETLLTIESSQWAAQTIKEELDVESMIKEGTNLVTRASKLGLSLIEFSLRTNIGSFLAKNGRREAAMEQFHHAREISTRLTDLSSEAVSAKHIARLALEIGDLHLAHEYAGQARATFERLLDWQAAADALKIEAYTANELTDSDKPASIGDVVRSLAPDSRTLDHLFHDLRAIDKKPHLMSPLPSATAATAYGDAVEIAEDVAEALLKIGVQVGSVIPRLRTGRHMCLACGLPIAASSRIAVSASYSEDHQTLKIIPTHPECSGSRWIDPAHLAFALPDKVQVNLEIECALLGEDIPAVVVDCYHGWGVDSEGAIADLFLESLRSQKFANLTMKSAPKILGNVPSATNRGPKISSRLNGQFLTSNASGVDIINGAALSFLPAWYRAVRKHQRLVLIFGRNLQGMTWESSEYFASAMQNDQLVYALSPVHLLPPGRNSACICTPRTGQKFKRCCGSYDEQ